MNKRLITITALLCFSLTSWAFDKAAYYSSANGKKGQSLKTALFDIIKNPNVTSYDGLVEAYKKTDMRADGKLRDWYSNITNYTWSDRNGNQSEGAGWNREHSVPQSWFSKGNPMKSDVVHVIPTDCYVNNRRSSYPLGEVGTITYKSANSYSKLGSCRTSGYTGTVFEPNDEIKGDMARIYFYMATCYEDKISSWGNNVFSTSKYPGLENWVINMMMRWSKSDPLDGIELARNEAVQEVQRNRNPFVDFPGLEEYIWGTYKDVAFSASNYRNPYDDGTLQTTIASFAQTRVTLEIGDTFTQTVTTNSDGEVTYESSNTDVVEVDARTGRVTALAMGIATVSAVIAQTDAFASAAASYTVQVTDGETPGPIPGPSGNEYVKVTSEPSDWSGTYLIVYEEDGLALNGAKVSDDNKISVAINGNTITVTDATEAAEFTIRSKADGYSIRGTDGKYIGHTGSKNELGVSASDDFTNTLSLLDGNAVIASDNYQLFYNKSAKLFRFYKSGQQPIALYRRVEADGIAEVNSEETTRQTDIYDLAGRRIQRIDRPGLYIIRGKKTFIK